MSALQLLRESKYLFPASTTMLVRPEQPENASLPIYSKLRGIVSVGKEIQPQKALYSIVFKLLGKLIELKLKQS